MVPGNETDRVKGLLELHTALKAIRLPWEMLWEEISRFIMPRRSPGQTTSLTPTTEKESRLFDITAAQANMTLANGCVAWMTPMEGAWFAFTKDSKVKDDALTMWLGECTETTRNKLALSSFYPAIHEFYLERSGFGTACLYAEEGRKSPLNVQCWPVGTFVVDEDSEGNVDTVIREFKLTPRQAKEKFGEENLSPKTKEKLHKGGALSLEQENYLHFIMPREVNPNGAPLDPKNLPIASIYIHADESHICREGGYPELPVFVSRYLEWGSGTGRCYGWSPAFFALPEARQVNFLQKMMDALAEKSAFPPVLAPEELEGEIDPNAMGVTYFSSQLAQAAMPKEWMNTGRYDIGKDRIMMRQESINKAFHVDLFQMFSQLQKQMTAREVAERSSEKLIQFSPTFARLTTELFNPLLTCIFGIGIRAGWYGEAPPTARMPAGEGLDIIAPPATQYTSRIAQALRALPVLASHRLLELSMQISQATGTTEHMDNLDTDEMIRLAASVESLPSGIERSVKDRDAIRANRAKAQAQAMQQAQALQAADAAAKLGRVPGDSPVGQVVESQLTGMGLKGGGQAA